MKELSANDIAEVLGGVVEGDPQTMVSSFARIENGKPGSLSFYANPKYEKYVYSSKASVLIVNRDFTPAATVTPVLVRVDNAYEAVATLLDYVTQRKYRRHRALFCRIRLSAKLGKKVYVGSFSYIGRRTQVGDCTKIYENVYIGDNVRIGSKCIIYPGVRIYPNMVIGDNVILHAGVVIGGDGFGFAPRPDGSYKKIEHTGNVIIENDVEIGANTTVDKSQMGSTVIHRGVKIDNLCQIGHNVEIGEDTVMCAMSGIAGSTKIGKRCVITGQVGIAGHLTIADDTKFGAQSGVQGSITKPGGSYMGSPAIPYNEFMRSYVMFRKQGRDGMKK